MSQNSRIKLVFKAISQLGPGQVGLYAIYRLGLITGHYDRSLRVALKKLESMEGSNRFKIKPCLTGLPDRNIILEQVGSQVVNIFKEADEIVNGYIRMFGGQPVRLDLTLQEPLENWTKYESGSNVIVGKDIKYIWEQGRFGWALKLAMAFHLSKDEKYAEAFWQYTEQFLSSNPPFMGPHWVSAQEVAIRLVAIAYASQIFTISPKTTPERLENIARTVAIHAERIPPTMVYARSQSNNHLISEAMGLYTASAVLPDHPLAPKWHKLGKEWMKNAFLTQITGDGTYTQHSTNYHRLMLQAALWIFSVHESSFMNEPITPELFSRLKASTDWLWKLVDPDTGQVPNLGHNDGAYIMPLTVCPYQDYRPVLHAAARLFHEINLVPHGPWDDMATWIRIPIKQSQKEVGLNYWRLKPQRKELNIHAPYLLKSDKNNSWATINAVKYRSRPAHADQLHVDLWWHGLNLAQDPGTYLYNTSPPWDNSLTSAYVHNTIVIDGQEFMQRAGRFLYLDWAQAKVTDYHTSLDGSFSSLIVEHNGYRKIGVIHSRKVTSQSDGNWEVIDRLDGPPDRVHFFRLHWLLPDYDFEILDPSVNKKNFGNEIHLKTPHGWVSLIIKLSSQLGMDHPDHTMHFQLAREGKVLTGGGAVQPITGWTSPTYGEKNPALAWIVNISHTMPIEIRSEWILPNES